MAPTAQQSVGEEQLTPFKAPPLTARRCAFQLLPFHVSTTAACCGVRMLVVPTATQKWEPVGQATALRALFVELRFGRRAERQPRPFQCSANVVWTPTDGACMPTSTQLFDAAQLTATACALVGVAAWTWLHDVPFQRSARMSDDERLWFGYSPIAKHHAVVAHETALIVDGLGDGALARMNPPEVAEAPAAAVKIPTAQHVAIATPTDPRMTAYVNPLPAFI